MTPAIDLTGIERHFQQGERDIHVLRSADLCVQPGEIIGLLGPSGAGKTTLLQIAGLLEKPDAGTVQIGGKCCNDLNDKDRTRIRREEIGFVYQFHNLLGDFSAEENVMMPLRINGQSRAKAETRSGELLDMVGLSDRLDHLPSELSGGEQQRVAIARALANEPSLLLADEPTGNLDEETAGRILRVFLDAVRDRGLGAIVATHNQELAKALDRCVMVKEGHIIPA